MPIGLERPTGSMVSDLHGQLIRDWTPRIRLDEEFRDLIRGTQIIETLEKNENRNMEPQEVHCVSIDTPILTRDLQWIKAGELLEEVSIVGFNEEATGKAPQFYHRKFEESKITHASTAEVDGYVVILENGDEIKCTGEHQFLVTQPSKKAAHWRNVASLYEEINERKIGGMVPDFYLPKYLSIWEHDTSYESGYLAGAFDSDGTLALGKARNYEVVAKFSQYDNEALAKVKSCLDTLGFGWGETIVKEPNPDANGIMHVITIQGGFKEIMRFLGIVRPPRLLERWSRCNLSTKKFMTNERVKILSIKRISVLVAVLTSSSQTYISAGYGSHNSGRAGGINEHALGLLMAQPSFHVDPLTLNTKDARESEVLERAIANMFEEHIKANDFWPSVGRDILAYGRAFIKALTVDSEWTAQSGYPVRKDDEKGSDYIDRVNEWKLGEAKFPFVITHISPLDLLPMLDGQDNVIASIEEKYVGAKILAEEMGSKRVAELIESGSVKWYDQLPIVEYIDAEWIGYFLSGTESRQRDSEDIRHFSQRSGAYEELQVFPHGMGKHPITMISGIMTGEPEYYFRWKSFLSDARESLELFDFLLSRLTTMVWAYYLPSYVWQIGGSTASFKGKDRPPLQVNLGGTTVLYSDETLDVLPVPSGLPDALLLLQQADDMIQRHTLEDVLFGRVTGSAPAFQVNLRIQVARSKLTPIAFHLATGISRVMEMMLRGVQHLGEMVPIGGEEITPTMAKSYMDRITAKITPKSPIDRNQAIGTAGIALEFGLPWDWIVTEILDIEDPATLRLMTDIRQLEQSEPIQAILQKEAVDQLHGLIEDSDFDDADELDLSILPSEFGDALARAKAQLSATPELDEFGQPIQPVVGQEGQEFQGAAPDGAAPQSIAPRGLLTENRQSPDLQPGATQVPSEQGLVE